LVKMKKMDKKEPKNETDKEKIEELTNLWKRALADYQNLEKRQEKEKSDFVRFASANLILKFIPVLGNLEKTVENLKDQGLELIVDEFRKVLREEGVEEIKSLGEKFNPQLMEAVEVVKGDGKNDDTVAEVTERGYLLSGKVLLPSKVKVFRAEISNEKTEELTKEQLLN